jgi:hypothetical protein
MKVYHATPKLRDFISNEIYTLQKIKSPYVVRFIEII